MNKLHKEILKTLSYFDYFKHPLKQEEISLYLRCKVSKEELSNALEELKLKDKILYSESYFALKGKEEYCVKRKELLKFNKRYLRIGNLMGRFIQTFPFVKGVMISGSLSKVGIKDKKTADIDYFIVTKYNRVYSCRLYLTLFKKIFLINSKRFFCINFFRDEKNLKFKKLDIYTATEIASLIPVSGKRVYKQVIQENWDALSAFFPNFNPKFSCEEKGDKQNQEKTFFKNSPNTFEEKARKLFTKNARKKYDVEKEGVTIDYSPNSSAHFPENRHRQILEYYQVKCKQINENEN